MLPQRLGAVVIRNDDLSVAAILDQMASWTHDEGEPPYPLADGCQDHALALAMQEAARSGRDVVTGSEPWHPTDR